MKDKLSEVDQKTKTNIQNRDGRNVGIFDILLERLNGAQKENRYDPNVQTAPGSIFDMFHNQVNQQKQQTQQPQQQRVKECIGEIIRQYNLDTRNSNQQILNQIQTQYVQDNNELDRKYA